MKNIIFSFICLVGVFYGTFSFGSDQLLGKGRCPNIANVPFKLGSSEYHYVQVAGISEFTAELNHFDQSLNPLLGFDYPLNKNASTNFLGSEQINRIRFVKQIDDLNFLFYVAGYTYNCGNAIYTAGLFNLRYSEENGAPIFKEVSSDWKFTFEHSKTISLSSVLFSPEDSEKKVPYFIAAFESARIPGNNEGWLAFDIIDSTKYNDSRHSGFPFLELVNFYGYRPQFAPLPLEKDGKTRFLVVYNDRNSKINGTVIAVDTTKLGEKGPKDIITVEGNFDLGMNQDGINVSITPVKLYTSSTSKFHFLVSVQTPECNLGMTVIQLNNQDVLPFMAGVDSETKKWTIERGLYRPVTFSTAGQARYSPNTVLKYYDPSTGINTILEMHNEENNSLHGDYYEVNKFGVISQA